MTLVRHFLLQIKRRGHPGESHSFLRLQKALSLGLIGSLEDFYTAARTVLIKSERYFDLYDQVFAHYFKGAELPEGEAVELDEPAKLLLEEWLRDPEGVARALGADVEELLRLTPQQLIEYFLERLKEQTEAHHGGSKWIGTKGTSPVGHSGYHPGGMRVGGRSQGQSAVKVALTGDIRITPGRALLTMAQIGEAQTAQYGSAGGSGQCQRPFTKPFATPGKSRLSSTGASKTAEVILLIDNGGGPDPCQSFAGPLTTRAQFKT
jgi:hypothetical protein